jgi:hypothetical protein
MFSISNSITVTNALIAQEKHETELAKSVFEINMRMAEAPVEIVR